MKHEDDEKNPKSTLNKHLSKVVKSLQTEAKKKGNSLTQSDSADALQFIHVLEAAFLHGLKTSYFEKHKPNKNLPKPQFWSLICQISHKDTLEQVRKLNYVRSDVGRCRAWLRLSLNDSALSSYLASLLHIPEYVILLTRYYDSHALFRDGEQSGIFLSYLQGTENLLFEYGSNSSMLDTWTRTPLELSGIISENLTRKELTSNLSVSHSAPDVNLSEKLSNSIESLSSTIDNRNEILPNVLQNGSQLLVDYSSSPSSVQHNPAIKVDDLDGNIDATELRSDQHISPDDVGLTSILFERHLSQRRSKSKQKQGDGRLTPQSRCTSLCSVNSAASVGSESAGAFVVQDIVRTKTSSADSQDERTNLDLQDSIRVSSPSIDPAFEDISVPADGNTSMTFALSADEPRDHNEEIPRQQSLKTNDYDTTNHENVSDIIANESDKSSNHCTEACEETMSNRSIDEPRRFVDVDGTSSTQSSHEDITDIYADFSTLPQTSAVNQTTEDSVTLMSSVSDSSGHGNSLLCGIGWSSEMDEESRVTSSHTLACTEPFLEDSYQSSDDSERTELTIREGFLQKKGETLLFWRARWFALTTKSLKYYKDQNCDVELGLFHLVDIETIDDKEIQKRKVISLKLLNGDEHQLAAESKQILRGWVKDISRAMDNAKLAGNAFAVNVSMIESTYVFMDTCDVDQELDGDSFPSVDRNTSWRSTMQHHVTRIATEQGLDAQNYQCADCAAPIGILYGVPRVCFFTGQYYCPQCHLNDEHQIPARIIHNWDFKKHKVSKRSKSFLLEMWKDPCIDISRVNPIAYRHLDELSNLLPLRTKLSSLYPYVSTCRKSPTQELVSILRSRYYMMENPHIYSAYDLLKTREKSLIKTLKKALTFAIQHVTNCDLCSSKGFHCEVCQKDEIIFAFQTDTTNQCEDCKTVYHKACLPDVSQCRKCVRRNQRLQQSHADDDQLYDYDSSSI